MTAFIAQYCPNHKKNLCEYWIYINNRGYGFCKECFSFLKMVHQLTINEV